MPNDQTATETQEEHFDIDEARKAQRALCESKGYPHFAPVRGVCWRCGRNIYAQHTRKRPEFAKPGASLLPGSESSYTTGYSVEYAGQHHIVGCPHCNRSYCD